MCTSWRDGGIDASRPGERGEEEKKKEQEVEGRLKAKG